MAVLIGAAPVAAAKETLQEARDKVKQSIVTVKEDIKASETEVKEATAKLIDSESKLKSAQQQLSDLEGQLAAAKAAKAEADAAHERAKGELAAAKAEVERAVAEVEAQNVLIGIAARAAYQQQSELRHLSVVLGSQDMSDLSSRLQWEKTIFESTAAQLQRLEELQAELEAARDKVAKAEATAKTAAGKAKKYLAEVQRLTNAASAQAAEVDALVKQNQQHKVAAEDELEQDKAEYEELQSQEAEIAKKIREEIAREKARKKALEKAEKEAREKAERENAWSTASKTGFVYPVHAKPGSPFGMRYHPILHYNRMHWGQDFGAKCGAPLYAMASGKVLSTSLSNRGLGNYTIINYGEVGGKNIQSGYAHQSKIIVKAGQLVAQGEVVGYVGTTGLSTGCHLHLQIYQDGTRVNPMKYLK
jgi:murein DD-endopeptidase MepM/ murein hydrolase activator NlpD